MAQEERIIAGTTESSELEELLSMKLGVELQAEDLEDFYGENDIITVEQLQKFGVGLTRNQFEHLAILVNESEEETTPAKTRYRAVSKGLNTEWKALYKLAGTLGSTLRDATETADSERKDKLLFKALDEMSRLNEALVSFGESRNAEHAVAIDIAEDADRFKQELSTVARWAFCDKGESAKRNAKPKAGKKADNGKGANGAGNGGKSAEGQGDGTGSDDEGNGDKPAEGQGDGTGSDDEGNGDKPAEGQGDGTGSDDEGNGDKPAEGQGDGTGSDDEGNGDKSAEGQDNGASGEDGKGDTASQDEESDAKLKRFRMTLARLVREGRLQVANVVNHDLTEEQLNCPNCGSRMTLNGYDHLYFEITVIPAKIAVIEHRGQVAVCNNCPNVRDDSKRTVVKAKSDEKRLASRSYLTPSLGAFLATFWLYFGITKYRMQAVTAMADFPMNSSVMGNLLGHLEEWIEPMYELLREELLKQPCLAADETTWHVMKYLIDRSRRDCRIFGFVSDPKGGTPIRLYEYQPDRDAVHITDFLEGYYQVVITDGYQGYDKALAIIHCMCWAHVRRKFFDCIPKHDLNKICAARAAYDLCSAIISAEAYMDEKYGPLTPEMRVEYRHKITKPIVDKFFQWCEYMKKSNRGNKSFKEAINYALNHKEQLSNFLDYGVAKPTSNLVESALRPIATLRKILMHTGNDVSTQLMMMLITLLQTAAINNLNPQDYLEVYLKCVLELGSNPPKEKLAELFPWTEKMQSAVKHLDFPQRAVKPMTEEDIQKARERLQGALHMAFAASKDLQNDHPEWNVIHWDVEALQKRPSEEAILESNQPGEQAVAI